MASKKPAKKGKPAAKRAVGRPTSYDPAFCETVVKLGQQGYGKAEIAEALGVSRQSLENWMETHEEFFDALTRAMSASQAWWEGQARSGIRCPTASFNAALFGKVMAARFPHEWREQKDVNVGGQKDGVPIQTESKVELSPEEAYKRALEVSANV